MIKSPVGRITCFYLLLESQHMGAHNAGIVGKQKLIARSILPVQAQKEKLHAGNQRKAHTRLVRMEILNHR